MTGVQTCALPIFTVNVYAKISIFCSTKETAASASSVSDHVLTTLGNLENGKRGQLTNIPGYIGAWIGETKSTMTSFTAFYWEDKPVTGAKIRQNRILITMILYANAACDGDGLMQLPKKSSVTIINMPKVDKYPWKVLNITLDEDACKDQGDVIIPLRTEAENIQFAQSYLQRIAPILR